MKVYIFFISIILAVTTLSEASWYICKESNSECVAKVEYEPSAEDLQKRGEFAIKSEDEIDLMKAEYRQGKIKERPKTQSEIDNEILQEEIAQEKKLVNDKIEEIAIEALKAEGKTFKHLDKKNK